MHSLRCSNSGTSMSHPSVVAVTLPVLRPLTPMSPDTPEVAVKEEGVKPASTWMVPAPLVTTCATAQVREGCLTDLRHLAPLPPHNRWRPMVATWTAAEGVLGCPTDLWRLAALPPHIRWRPAGPLKVLVLPATTCTMCHLAASIHHGGLGASWHPYTRCRTVCLAAQMRHAPWPGPAADLPHILCPSGRPEVSGHLHMPVPLPATCRTLVQMPEC